MSFCSNRTQYDNHTQHCNTVTSQRCDVSTSRGKQRAARCVTPSQPLTDGKLRRYGDAVGYAVEAPALAWCVTVRGGLATCEALK